MTLRANDRVFYDLLRRNVAHVGVVHQADLARRYGKSRSVVNVWVKRDDFPQPFAQVGGSPLWFAEECDAWVRRRGLLIHHNADPPQRGGEA